GRHAGGQGRPADPGGDGEAGRQHEPRRDDSGLLRRQGGGAGEVRGGPGVYHGRRLVHPYQRHPRRRPEGQPKGGRSRGHAGGVTAEMAEAAERLVAYTARREGDEAPAVDLLRWPVVGRFLRWRGVRYAMQAPLFLLSAVLVLHGLYGPDLAPKNLATLI